MAENFAMMFFFAATLRFAGQHFVYRSSRFSITMGDR